MTELQIHELFAVVCVSDIERSTDWYTRLIGRVPDDRPMDGLVQWRNITGAGLQLVRNTEKAGNSMITLVIPNMSKTRSELEVRGLTLEADVKGDFSIIAQINDPDHNRLTLAEPPKG
jgi:hypothetical protein